MEVKKIFWVLLQLFKDAKKKTDILLGEIISWMQDMAPSAERARATTSDTTTFQPLSEIAISLHKLSLLVSSSVKCSIARDPTPSLALRQVSFLLLVMP